MRVTTTTSEGEERLIGEVFPGEPVGEFALLTNKPRSATVYAIRETLKAKISSSMFAKPIQKYPAFMGNVARFSQKLFGDLLIEDLWYPFFCVASNLSTAQPVIYQRGALWRAIRSSLAIPGVFTPVIEDGEVIIDGGVMDNFPVRLMADLCESEHIIGVNIMSHWYKKR